MFESEWKARQLPAPLLQTLSGNWEEKRAAVKKIICDAAYGALPPLPLGTAREVLLCDPIYCAGKATLQKIRLTLSFPGGDFSFPYTLVSPNAGGRHLTVLHINFRDAVPDRYMPTEELIDHGLAVASFCYRDITADNADFIDGLAGVLFPGGQRPANGAGKLMIWAYGAMRVLDDLWDCPQIDTRNIAVAGHSRLGKTALLAAALDERFSVAYSNCSGCMGAALTRGKGGESLRAIVKQFPYWFCEAIEQYDEDTLPFDQHDLLSLIAPRKLYIASAVEDHWADPISEYLSCAATSPIYESLGVPGFLSEERYPTVGDSFSAGKIGYHLRPGTHYLSRTDWLQFIPFFIRHAEGL